MNEILRTRPANTIKAFDFTFGIAVENKHFVIGPSKFIAYGRHKLGWSLPPQMQKQPFIIDHHLIGGTHFAAVEITGVLIGIRPI